MKQDARCGNCSFVNYNGVGQHECRRHSPITGLRPVETSFAGKPFTEIHQKTVWPIVSNYDWCGDHERQESESPASART